MPRYIRAGKYNTEHETELPVVIGGGTSKSNRKDIMTMDWDGNVVLGGGIETAGGSLDENGNLSIDGNAEIAGSAEIGDDVEISGDLDIVADSPRLTVTRTDLLRDNKTYIYGGSISTNVIYADSVYANGLQKLFVPYMNEFRIFFNLAYTNEIYFSIQSSKEYPENAKTNAQLLECLYYFLFQFDFVSDEHLNTIYLIASNQSSIFPVHGTFNGCIVLGMYLYRGSDDPEYQVDIICVDSSETSGYKVYTWVSSTIPPTPSGETWITPADIWVQSYYTGYARFE